jgi:glyoxylate reductase
MARVFVTRELPGPALDRLRARHHVDVWPGAEPPPPGELRAGLAAADGALTMLTDAVGRDELEAAPRLKGIANYAVGTDNIDLEAATALRVPVGNTPDVLTDSTADLAVALMLAAMRRLAEAEAKVRAGEWRTWEPAGLLGRDLHRSTVLVVGPGRIGSAVARRVEGFGARVLTAGHADDLGPLLAEADVVTLHCPLTPETRGLVGEEALRAMGPGSVLVNTARGPVVDTAALEHALEAGWIGAAALDVTDPEPLPAGHPLLDAPNLLVVPHIGSATHYTRGAMADMAVDNLLAALAGEPMPHCANPEVYGQG